MKGIQNTGQKCCKFHISKMRLVTETFCLLIRVSLQNKNNVTITSYLTVKRQPTRIFIYVPREHFFRFKSSNVGVNFSDKDAMTHGNNNAFYVSTRISRTIQQKILFLVTCIIFDISKNNTHTKSMFEIILNYHTCTG